ncbi:hypothetical protein D3C84_669780 [compost metagenome]
MLQAAHFAVLQQGLQGAFDVMVIGLDHRHVGRQIDQAGLRGFLFQMKQRGFFAASQYIGATSDLAADQMPSGSLTVGLLGGAGVEPQRPGQTPLRRQACADRQFATLDGVGNGIDQCQVTGLPGVRQGRGPHLLLAMQYKLLPIQ